MGVWIFIGLAVGLVMGLTGAGAAMAAYPLLLHVAHVPLTTCTLIALFVLVCGSGLNGWFQRKSSHLRLGALVSLTSVPGSFLASWMKPSIPPNGIKALILLLCLTSMILIWRKPRGKSPSTQHSPTTFKLAQSWYKIIPLGASIGALVTLTGLGGGFLLVPSYLHFFGLPLSQAVATSLFTIFLTATGSAIVQASAISEVFELLPLICLVGGTLSSALIVRQLARSLPPAKFEHLQKWCFSIVVVGAFLSVLMASSV